MILFREWAIEDGSSDDNLNDDGRDTRSFYILYFITCINYPQGLP